MTTTTTNNNDNNFETPMKRINPTKASLSKLSKRRIHFHGLTVAPLTTQDVSPDTNDDGFFLTVPGKRRHNFSQSNGSGFSLAKRSKQSFPMDLSGLNMPDLPAQDDFCLPMLLTPSSRSERRCRVPSQFKLQMRPRPIHLQQHSDDLFVPSTTLPLNDNNMENNMENILIPDFL